MVQLRTGENRLIALTSRFRCEMFEASFTLLSFSLVVVVVVVVVVVELDAKLPYSTPQ